MGVQDTGDVLCGDGLSLSYGDRLAVDDVSLRIATGETYGLLGPNGSGKTTTISMLAGILTPDSGSVTIAGRPISARSREGKGAIGLVPQEIALYEDLTARENLVFFGRLQGLSGADLDRRLAEVIDVVGLADRADDRVEEYSGGMKRRANIAAGLLHGPELLILDEPTVGVDPQSRNQILESIERLGGEGLSVLYTTHYMEEAERLCDRVGILDHGRLIAEGTRDELVARIGERDLILVSGGFPTRGDDVPTDEPSAAGEDDDAADAGRSEGATATGAGEDDRLLKALSALGGVIDAQLTARGVEVLTGSAAEALPDTVATIAASPFEISSIEVREPNLEAVFLDLTGRALRD